MNERKDETIPDDFWIAIEEIIANCKPNPDEETYIGNTGIQRTYQIGDPDTCNDLRTWLLSVAL